MPTKRIFILNGHPAETSLNRALAETYADAARNAGHDVRLTHLSELSFDPDFGMGSEGYRNFKPLEPGLETVLSDMEWAEHIVMTTPMWWGGLPAKLKGLLDRALIPGRTFDTRNTTMLGLPAPLLGGRTGRVIMTSDTPGWLMAWIYRNALLRQIRAQIFGFIGVTPTRITHFSGASEVKPKVVSKWLDKVRAFGAAAA